MAKDIDALKDAGEDKRDKGTCCILWSFKGTVLANLIQENKNKDGRSAPWD
eukprot:COSAG01_NODE_78163_length_150_cov_195.137255_1_plen_50_part_11